MTDLQIRITDRKCDVPDRVHRRAEDRISRLQRFQPRLRSADVVFSEEPGKRSVEAVLSIDGQDRVVARGEGPEFRAALDVLLDRLSRILRRQREQHTDHRGPSRGEAQSLE